MKYFFVNVISGDLFPYLKDITLFGRIEDGEDGGIKGNFYIFGCKDKEQKQFYEGILEYDKATNIIGLQTLKEVEEFWLNGCDGMFLTLNEENYNVLRSD